MFDQELVLRFFALKNHRKAFKHDVDDFLTKYMEGVSDSEIGLPFDFEKERQAFAQTFAILAKTMSDEAFAYANRNRDKLNRGFSVYHFESFTIGLQPYLDRIDIADQPLLDKLREMFVAIKLDPDFVKLTTGGGKNSPGPLNDRIDFVARKLDALWT